MLFSICIVHVICAKNHYDGDICYIFHNDGKEYQINFLSYFLQ